MECRQEIFGGRASQRSTVTAIFTGALMLAGCTDGASMPDATLEPPSAGGGIGLPPAGELQYPTDSEGNDPAGLIVTGLGDIAAAQTVSPWLMSARVFRRASEPATTGDVAVELTRYAENFPVSAHIRFFSEPLDECVDRNDQNEEGIDLSNPPPPGINGGETVVLNTPSGPWYSLYRRQMMDEQWVYRIQDPLPGMLPADTTLSIPGGAFPTVAAYPLFEPEPVMRLHPVFLQPVTAESRYRWVPFNQSAHVKIDFMAYDGAGDFQGFPVSCWVIDDGSFALPEAAVQALEAWQMQADTGARLAVRYSRVYARLDLIDGMVFHQNMEVAE